MDMRALVRAPRPRPRARPRRPYCTCKREKRQRRQVHIGGLLTVGTDEGRRSEESMAEEGDARLPGSIAGDKSFKNSGVPWNGWGCEEGGRMGRPCQRTLGDGTVEELDESRSSPRDTAGSSRAERDGESVKGAGGMQVREELEGRETF